MAPERPLVGLLGAGATYEGDLSFSGRVRLDGLFRGRLSTSGVLEVGGSGRVEGEIDAAVVKLAGRVDGRVKARGLLVVEATGCVVGEVDAPSLEVRPGATFKAMLKVGADRIVEGDP